MSGSSDHPSSEVPAEGIWMLDDSGKHLELKAEDQLAQDSSELKIDTPIEQPSNETIADYLSHLPHARKEQSDGLRGLGWDDSSIHNLLTLIDNTRKHMLASLRMRGKGEDIERLKKLFDQDITDYSHMRRPLTSRAEEDYQVQLYLLEEVKRQRRIMAEVDGSNDKEL
ncbi:hypothetical protein N7462_006028 [Penicillium macrosclerotiorum]|uniref:uncharacterized protein n=1 Tax=Penicillium macrosclerotiorum TaxID=303699 RepID=UPI0025483EDF|nr:uncharacterized protein N7462_006028 [Penicillium macrosclerotiorum]KAJ5682863.1 hypothetical protein N7462_006028 [Penicillium macrosclerotiorum]